MANENKYLDQTGLSTLWGRIKSYLTTDHIKPMMSKTYTGVIGTDNTWADATFFFGKILPTSYSANWQIKYRIYAEAAGVDYCKANADVTITGAKSAYISFKSFNQIQSTSYRPAYYHQLYRATQTGITNQYGHLLGIRLQSSWNPTTVANARTVKVEILRCQNCTFTFFDSVIKYANAPGTGSTNYNGVTELDFANNGLQETGDNNDPNYRDRVYYSGQWKTYQKLTRYVVLFQKDANYLLSPTTVDNATGTSKGITSSTFNPFGQIFYYATTTNRSAGTTIADNATLNRRYELFDLRYSFNTGTTLTAYQPVYVATQLQSDGSVKFASTPIVQSLPTTAASNMLYIFLGKSVDTYRMQLYLKHPVYRYEGTGYKEITPSDLKSYWQYNSTNDTIELIFPS